MLKIAVLILTFIASIQFGVDAKIVRYTLRMRYFYGAPDGVTRTILGANYQFPGPTLRAALNDTVYVKVENWIIPKEVISIHWHGFEQVKTASQDGLAGVTQCGIPYGHSMLYTLHMRQAGTYWWHSHHLTQYTDGNWGAFIVYNRPKEAYPYDDELTFMLSDWHHLGSEELLKWYLSPESNGHEPIPDSISINGRGNYPCQFARAQRRTCWEPWHKYGVYEAQRGKIYRIRVINTSTMANFNFSIDGHRMQPIEVDGVDMAKMDPVDTVRIFPAQRYSFLVEMNAYSRGNSFWIRSKAYMPYNLTAPNVNRFPEAFYENSEVKAILQYYSDPYGRTLADPDDTLVPPNSSRAKEVEDTGIRPQEGATQGRPATHNIYWTNSTVMTEESEEFDNSQSKMDGINEVLFIGSKVRPKLHTKMGYPRRNYNHPLTFPTPNAKLLDFQPCPPLGGETAPPTYDQLVEINVTFFKNGDGVIMSGFNGISFETNPRDPVLMKVLRNETLPREVHAIATPYGKVVQVVINNPNPGPGGHPFHLHGHTFWEVGTGQGIYDDARDRGSLILNGTRRDTTGVGPYGWVAIRYLADNPGPWLLHCHINWHLHSGLGLVFIEGAEEMRQNAEQLVSEEAKRVCAIQKPRKFKNVND